MITFLSKDNISYKANIYPLNLFLLIFLLFAYLTPTNANSSENTDPHYTKAGFFDIHVCNWPDRPLFFLALVSSTKFNDISSIDIFLPNNDKLGSLNLSKYRLIQDKKKNEKRVFMKQFEIPKNAGNGWYYTKINMKNGETIVSKDYVVIEKLQRARLITPDISKNLTSIPSTFKWNALPGSQFYKVFIKDMWESEVIFTSKLLTKPEVKLPKGLLEKGGYYSIQIHARDVNEHQLLGDFNHGSLTRKMKFTIQD